MTTVSAAAAQAAFNATFTQPVGGPGADQPPATTRKKFNELTKEEKLARLSDEIKALQQKYDDVLNDRIKVAVKKEVVLPTVGDTVVFNYGRKTATSDPVELTGTVVAIKPSAALANGKTAPAQIKVQTGEGFDATFAVIYPGQVTSIVPQAQDSDGINATA